MVRPSNLFSQYRPLALSEVPFGLLNVVHGGDGLISVGFLAIANEAEAAATTSITVLDDDLYETG